MNHPASQDAADDNQQQYPQTPVVSRKNRKRTRRTATTTTTVTTAEAPDNQKDKSNSDIPSSEQAPPPKKPKLNEPRQQEQEDKEVNHAQPSTTSIPPLLHLSDILAELEDARRMVSRSSSTLTLSSTSSSSTSLSLPQRENEEQFLKSTLRDCIEHHRGNSMILAGQPGTGKTLCVDMVLAPYVDQTHAEIRVLKLNCMSFVNSGAFIDTVGQFLLLETGSGGGSGGGGGGALLQKLLEASRDDSNSANGAPVSSSSSSLSVNEKRALIGREYERRVLVSHGPQQQSKDEQVVVTQPRTGINKLKLIVLDEIESVPDSVLLQNMLQWSKTRPLIIIGITNDANNVSMWKQGFEQQLSFSPYSKEQMKQILVDRLHRFEHLLSKPVLDFIAAKTFDSGSARTCLDIAEAAIGSVVYELSQTIKTKGDLEVNRDDNPYKVQLKHVQPHIKTSFTISAKIETISGLPSAQKILLCSCFKLLKMENKEFTIETLTSFYSKFKQHPELKEMVTRLSSQQIIDFCKRLQDNGLISIAVPRGVKTMSPKCKISMDLSENDMVSALGKYSWYTKIMEIK